MFRLIKVFAGCTCLCAGFGCDVAHVYVLFKQVVRLSMVKDGAVAVTQMGEGITKVDREEFLTGTT